MFKSTQSNSVFYALIFLACMSPLISQTVQAKPVLFGWLESIYLQPSGERIVAKLDTGAKTSSVYASNIQLFKKDGKRWVRFTIPAKRGGNAIDMERPLLRETLVKEHIGESVPRYVVKLNFCLEGKFYNAEFTLADRENFNYRAILGRSMLQRQIIVDPGKKFIADKTCKIVPTGTPEKSP
ncbi:MAG: ATP-dependent zinc protease [Gammaproteobacteria bacterium]|nr:ATP-dependent zinc protease [Gammaproteobacteria bacterium]